jgi:hypothetical protein
MLLGFNHCFHADGLPMRAIDGLSPRIVSDDRTALMKRQRRGNFLQSAVSITNLSVGVTRAPQWRRMIIPTDCPTASNFG